MENANPKKEANKAPTPHNRNSESIERLDLKAGKDVPWLCKSCNQILGVVGGNGAHIRVKYKDLFLFIEGGKVTQICRKCAQVNIIVDIPEGMTPAGAEESIKDDSLDTLADLQVVPLNKEGGESNAV